MKREFSTLIVFLVIASTIFTNTANCQNNNYKAVLADCLNQHKIQLNKTDCMNGVTAPDFVASTIDGKNIRLSEFRGQVVVLNFWFIACAPCRSEVPGLNEVVEKFKNEKVNFVSVAIDSAPELKTYLAKNKFLFETIADPTFSICQKQYNINGYPTTIIIDKNGKIKFYSIGGKVVDQDKNNNVFFPSANKSTSETVTKEIIERLTPVINACLSNK